MVSEVARKLNSVVGEMGEFCILVMRKIQTTFTEHVIFGSESSKPNNIRKTPSQLPPLQVNINQGGKIMCRLL